MALPPARQSYRARTLGMQPWSRVSRPWGVLLSSEAQDEMAQQQPIWAAAWRALGRVPCRCYRAANACTVSLHVVCPAHTRTTSGRIDGSSDICVHTCASPVWATPQSTSQPATMKGSSPRLCARHPEKPVFVLLLPTARIDARRDITGGGPLQPRLPTLTLPGHAERLKQPASRPIFC